MLSDAKHYCPNVLKCTPQIVGKFEHFISRKALNIDGLGVETIELLVNEGLIIDVSDLYCLKRDDLLTLDRMADRSVDNLLFAIKQSKKVPFEKLLFGLGIRFVSGLKGIVPSPARGIYFPHTHHVERTGLSGGRPGERPLLGLEPRCGHHNCFKKKYKGLSY